MVIVVITIIKIFNFIRIYGVPVIYKILLDNRNSQMNKGYDVKKRLV